MTSPARVRFSLRTLLVLVAVAAVGMRIERSLAAIDRREAECRRLRKIGAVVLDGREYQGAFDAAEQRVPWLRRLLGDRTYVLVAEPPGGFDAETVGRIQRLLPEARISYRTHDLPPPRALADAALAAPVDAPE